VDLEPAQASAVVFRGSKALCHEFSLVLEAKSIEHQTQESEGLWVLNVPTAMLRRAYEEISHYCAERSTPRSVPEAIKLHSGAMLGGAP